MVLNLLLIGLAITLEPFPLTAFILVLTAEKGIWKGMAFILGWVACLVVVIAAVIAATGNNPPRPQTVPSTAALAVKLAVGVVLIVIALRKRRQRGRPRKPAGWMAKLDRLSLLSVAGLAAFLQPWTLVAAGAATILEAKLTTPDSYLALIFFCLLATSSYLYLELYATFAGSRADARLGQLRDWLNSHQDQVIIAVFLLLGLWLAGNSLYLLVG